MRRIEESPTEIERFWSFVSEGPGCQEWQGIQDGYGYGSFRFRGDRRLHKAHRVSWELTHAEPIPPGFQIHHICKNRLCVNPAHLQVLPQSIHASFDSVNARKTHCPQGHPYDEENTYWFNGARQCRACRRINQAAKRNGRDGSCFNSDCERTAWSKGLCKRHYQLDYRRRQKAAI